VVHSTQLLDPQAGFFGSAQLTSVRHSTQNRRALSQYGFIASQVELSTQLGTQRWSVASQTFAASHCASSRHSAQTYRSMSQ
jgi:hypothetical protein